MTEIKRDMTSFTGVLGSESFDKLGELKFANMGGGGATLGMNTEAHGVNPHALR